MNVKTIIKFEIQFQYLTPFTLPLSLSHIKLRFCWFYLLSSKTKFVKPLYYYRQTLKPDLCEKKIFNFVSKSNFFQQLSLLEFSINNIYDKHNAPTTFCIKMLFVVEYIISSISGKMFSIKCL